MAAAATAAAATAAATQAVATTAAATAAAAFVPTHMLESAPGILHPLIKQKFLSQPGCAAGTVLVGTVYTHMCMSYQGLVAGSNLLAEWRSEAQQAGLSTRRPLLAVALPTALL